jgi:crotonobetainyl-CoA:carnitine CoA-transferase CaiB-like acyl-CoA transferase
MGLRRPAPRLGEHTREVLDELGLTKDEIDALASRRIIS